MKKILNFVAFALAGCFAAGLVACNARHHTDGPVDDGVISADDMVGTWKSTGYFVYKSGGSDVIVPHDHTMTVSKIDENTVEISDMLGLEKYTQLPRGVVDKFRATVSDNTLSIAAQSMEPTFDGDGWPVYLCRYIGYDTPAGTGFQVNWMKGFENIPISKKMEIDLSEGGFFHDILDSGEAVYCTFIPLTKDPADQNALINSYNWFYFNTVWKKI